MYYLKKLKKKYQLSQVESIINTGLEINEIKDRKTAKSVKTKVL
jgi:hypothetical protein